MMKTTVLLGLLTLPVAAGAAGTCEENFKTSGDPRNGAAFATSVTIPGLSVRSALGQMQKTALDDGFEVGNEAIREQDGTLTILQKSSMLNRGFLIYINADAGGQIAINSRLNRDQVAKPEDIRGGMCSMLGRLKTGPEGEAIANAAREKTGVEQVRSLKAHDLAKELDKAVEREQGKRGEGQVDMNRVYAKYLNKRFRIDGQIARKGEPTPQFPNEDQEIEWITTGHKGLLAFKEDSFAQGARPTILCKVPKELSEYFKALRNDDWATLTGKVTKFEGNVMTLENCRPDA
jgi:hypothetical protein